MVMPIRQRCPRCGVEYVGSDALGRVCNDCESGKGMPLVGAKTKKRFRMPICPYCEKEMSPMRYEGYYEEFEHWQCKCVEFPKDVEPEIHKGYPN